MKVYVYDLNGEPRVSVTMGGGENMLSEHAARELMHKLQAALDTIEAKAPRGSK